MKPLKAPVRLGGNKQRKLASADYSITKRKIAKRNDTPIKVYKTHSWRRENVVTSTPFPGPSRYRSPCNSKFQKCTASVSNEDDDESEEEVLDKNQNNSRRSNVQDQSNFSIASIISDDEVEESNHAQPLNFGVVELDDDNEEMDSESENDRNEETPLVKPSKKATFKGPGNAFGRSLQIYLTPESSVLAILQHPLTIVIKGRAEISSLSGSVLILGYEINPLLEKPVVVYSTSLCHLTITTKMVEQKTIQHRQLIKEQLMKIMPLEKVSQIVNSLTQGSVVLRLRHCQLPYAVDFTCGYVPRVLPLRYPYGILHGQEFQLLTEAENVIMIPKKYVSMAEKVEALVSSSIMSEKPIPSVVAVGTKNAGKSMYLRYLVNTFLNRFPKVMYLDLDLGQTEFTPPGVISLVEIKSPLLGPPFTHPRRPIRIAFIGTTSITEPQTYTENIDKLLDYYYRNFRDIPLFINTCGWIRGIGKDCLNHVMKVVEPKVAVSSYFQDDVDEENEEDESSDDSSSSEISDSNLDDVKLKVAVRQRQDTVSDAQFPAPLRRDLSILSYFGLGKSYFRGSSIDSLNSLTPICIRASDIVLHCPCPIADERLIYAFNASFVALCTVDPAKILESVDNPKLPKKLVKDADFSECLGFGFVRAIDVTRNLLYIVTPESPDILNVVNTLVKSEIQMPDVVFTQQKIYGEPLPYIVQLTSRKILLSQKIKLTHYENGLQRSANS